MVIWLRYDEEMDGVVMEFPAEAVACLPIPEFERLLAGWLHWLGGLKCALRAKAEQEALEKKLAVAEAAKILQEAKPEDVKED
jgi:hypothetical protein